MAVRASDMVLRRDSGAAGGPATGPARPDGQLRTFDGIPNQHMLRQLFLQSDGLMCVADAGHFVVLNPAWYRLLGWPVVELLSRPFLAFVHPHDVDRTRRHIRDVLSVARTTVTFESRFRASDGSYRWLLWNVSSDAGCWYATATDITSRRRAEEQARLLSAVVENAEDAIFTTDPGGLIASWPTGAQRLYGYTPDEVLGRPMSLLVPQERDGEESQILARVLAGERVSHFETCRRHKDGSLVDVSLSLSPVRNDRGETVAVSSVARDISDRRAADEALRLSESRLRAILEATTEGVWRVDADNVIDYVNHQIAATLGYRPDEMLGQPLSRFLPDNDPAANARPASAVPDRSRPDVAERRQARLLRRDGTACWAVVSITHLFDDRDDFAGSVAVVAPLTQPGKAQETSPRESERLLSAITANMEEGVVCVDASGLVTSLNGAATELVGWDAASAGGRLLISEICDDSACLTEGGTLTECWAYGQEVRCDDAVFRCRNGASLPVSFQAAPLVDSGRLSGAVIVFRELTQLKADQVRRRSELDAMAWVGRAKDALDDDRFELYAQPIVSVRTGEHLSHELLIRMRDLSGRLVEPGFFLPAAERYGLIQDIDRWVVSRAVELAASGHAVDVNLSGASVGDSGLVRLIKGDLGRLGADPSRLTFEITETAVMSKLNDAAQFVQHLRALGCGVALDDFGTGFGSFTYLKSLPVTRLKIDRQFIHHLADDERNQHVVQAVVGLARAFDLAVLAEGVEDEATLALLAQYGIDFVQGYHLGRPAPFPPPPVTPLPGTPLPGTP